MKNKAVTNTHWNENQKSRVCTIHNIFVRKYVQSTTYIYLFVIYLKRIYVCCIVFSQKKKTIYPIVLAFRICNFWKMAKIFRTMTTFKFQTNNGKCG